MRSLWTRLRLRVARWWDALLWESMTSVGRTRIAARFLMEAERWRDNPWEIAGSDSPTVGMCGEPRCPHGITESGWCQACDDARDEENADA